MIIFAWIMAILGALALISALVVVVLVPNYQARKDRPYKFADTETVKKMYDTVLENFHHSLSRGYGMDSTDTKNRKYQLRKLTYELQTRTKEK